MSARRVSRRQPQRGAVNAVDPRIRNEVGAIALLAFAVLSIVAIIADQGAVLHWWRSFLVSLLGWGAFAVPFLLAALAAELWFGLMRRSAIIPISGGACVSRATRDRTAIPARGEPFGGAGGNGARPSPTSRPARSDGWADRSRSWRCCSGVVVAANRTLGDFIAPLEREARSAPASSS